MTNSELTSKFSNIYISLIFSIMTKDISKVKHFLSDNVFLEYNKKINTLINNNEIEMFDELNVEKIEIIDKKIVNNKEVIEVKIISRYMDYFTDLDGNYKRGINTKRIKKENNLIFSKKINSVEKNYYTCPNCGANVDVNYSGKCNYCNCIIDITDTDYKLDKIEVLDI